MPSSISFIAERLRALRKRHAITQQECADMADLNFRYYQRLEAGTKKQVWVETVERIAAVYGLEGWELLRPKMPDETHIKRRIVRSTTHYGRKRRGPYYKVGKGGVRE